MKEPRDRDALLDLQQAVNDLEEERQQLIRERDEWKQKAGIKQESTMQQLNRLQGQFKTIAKTAIDEVVQGKLKDQMVTTRDLFAAAALITQLQPLPFSDLIEGDYAEMSGAAYMSFLVADAMLAERKK